LEAGANPVLVAFRLGYVSTRMVEQHYSGRLDRTRRSARRWVRGTLRHGCGMLRARTRRAFAPHPLLTCGSSERTGIRTRDPHLGKETRGVPYHPVAY